MIERKDGFGANPRAGVLPDRDFDRLYVGRQVRSGPRSFDTVGFGFDGHVPLPTESLALDASRDLIYTSGPLIVETTEFFGQNLASFRRTDLAVEDPSLITFNDFDMSPGSSTRGSIEMTVLPDGDKLCYLYPGFSLEPPRFLMIDLATSSETARFTLPRKRTGNLTVDEVGERVFFTNSNHLVLLRL